MPGCLRVRRKPRDAGGFRRTLVRQGVRGLLERVPDRDVVGEASEAVTLTDRRMYSFTLVRLLCLSPPI
jgi:hypothetical protein